MDNSTNLCVIFQSYRNQLHNLNRISIYWFLCDGNFDFKCVNHEKSRSNHLNSSKFYLNRRETKILSNTFMQHILNEKLVIVLTVIFSTFDFGKYGSGLAKRNCQSVLNLLREDNLNKLIFAHSNINSIKNCLAEQVQGNTDNFQKC